MLKIKGLRKSFGKTEVLKGIDLEIKEGEVVVIVGPSGGGKTTLLRCINALEKAEEGDRITFTKDTVLKDDIVIPQNVTLEISENVELTIPQDVVLKNNGLYKLL